MDVCGTSRLSPTCSSFRPQERPSRQSPATQHSVVLLDPTHVLFSTYQRSLTPLQANLPPTMSSSNPLSPRVPIHVANKKAYVWSVEAMRALRVQHHICGVLTGTLPGITQQNMFLGLPLLLLPEEVVLLVENGSSSGPARPSSWCPLN